jgi:hypothetical protein
VAILVIFGRQLLRGQEAVSRSPETHVRPQQKSRSTSGLGPESLNSKEALENKEEHRAMAGSGSKHTVLGQIDPTVSTPTPNSGDDEDGDIIPPHRRRPQVEPELPSKQRAPYQRPEGLDFATRSRATGREPKLAKVRGKKHPLE